ncbi:SDR family oxidoreductase [Deinococcus roseus]|uniref:Short-chain dehydrogenase/reductase n=1 Tax=Deinococcus roseus TaxID=392414 RepID=A0ABQ2D4T6_9DEIO|nr:SDR family oxidoreductase [Deinococcus roseus]GGJ43341.1 short-chain dehydrogenase/reductase [Deinococcus roseus]
MKTALITGTSTGIGQDTALTLARAGLTVIATMRDPSRGQILLDHAQAEGLALEVQQLDVQNPQQITEVVNGILQRYGQLDVLINNAGAGYLGTTEETPVEDLMKVLDVNFIGAYRLTQAVLPHMRERGQGHILSVSSIGGLIGQPFNDAYCAAKFALEGMMESLAAVMQFYGVRVSLIEPGPVNTAFVANVGGQLTGGALTSPEQTSPYQALREAYLNGSAEVFSSMGQTGADVAEVILQAINAENPHLRYQTSGTIQHLASLKYVDPTGDSVLKLNSSRLAAAGLEIK